MRAFFFLAGLFISLASPAQYYYKDIVGTRESADLIRTYMKNKVSRVHVNSYDADNVRNPDFFVEQQFSPASLTLKTVTRNAGSQSVLISYADVNGNVVKTVDSSNVVVSTTTYSYNQDGQLVSISHSSSDSSRSLNKSDQHLWYWQGKSPVKMLRIKNRVDTTFVDFKLDESGNVIEENETYKGVKSGPIYYYYNDDNQLTDVVRHNGRVGILLPEYMFEYSEKNEVIQKITVPINNPDYLIWRYQYNQQGLKTKEKVYSNKDKRNAVGTVEYQYTFSS